MGISQAVAGITTTVLTRSSAVTLPAGYNTASTQNAGFYSVSCASPSSCVGAGRYMDASGAWQPMVGLITDGAPGPAQEVTLPAGYDSANSQDAFLYRVSCASATWCVAAGNYVDNTFATQAMVVSITNGVAGTAQEVTLPAGHDTSSGQAASLLRVSCGAAGSCVAVGYYKDATGARQAMMVPIANGVAGTAREVTLPAGHDTSSGQKALLFSVSCASGGSCVAGGAYKDAGGGFQAMVVPITNGAPETAQEVALPSGHDASSNQNAALWSASCPSPGSCVAIGNYKDTSGIYRAMVVPIANGVPETAQEVTLPAGQNTSSNQNASLTSVDCASADSCVAGGYYRDASVAQQAMVVSILNGVPGTAQEVILPAGYDTSSNQSAGVDSVSCGSAGSCIGTAYYSDMSTSGQVAVVPITDGTAGPSQEVILPAGARATNQSAEPDGVSCASPGSCIALGQYTDTGGGYVPMTVAIQRTLAVTSSSLRKARVGIRYHAGLKAFGGIGTYSWSIVHGRLPRGLRLNRTTGKISGIPRAGGAFRLKLRVRDPGPPAQRATRVLTLRVAKPLVKIPAGVLHLHGARVTVPLRCTRAFCAGTVKLKLKIAGRTVTIGHHGFRIGPGHSAKVKMMLNSTELGAIAASRSLSVLEVVIVKHGPNRKQHKTIR